MKTAFAGLISFLFLASCASLSPTAPSSLSDVTALPHITSHCRIYDTNGKLLRWLPGNTCLFNNDGSTFAEQGTRITFYDNRLNSVWEKKFTFLHHTFRKSELADELLVLDSAVKTLQDRNIRSDVLRILNMNGEIVKSLNFDDLLASIYKDNPALNRAKKTIWADHAIESKNPVFEYSHVNSFYEFYELRDGKKVHTGYVVNCNLKKLILILDKDLKEIKKVISTAGREVHDVYQLNEGQLIFYQNHGDMNVVDGSSIVGYDLENEKFFEIYRPDGSLSAPSCSSVQMLGAGRIFITHSNCGVKRRKDFSPVLEVVDLNKNKTVRLQFEKFHPMSRALLLDLSSHLKNSAGL